MELVRNKKAGELMLKRWYTMVEQATLTGGLINGKKYWQDEPNLRQQCLEAEAREVPWDIQLEKRKLELRGKLHRAHPGSLAGAIVAVRGTGTLVSETDRLQASWGMSVKHGRSQATRKRWKRAMKHKAEAKTATRLAAIMKANTEATNEEFINGRGDGMMIAGLNGRDEATKWAQLLPGSRKERVELRRFKLGSFPGIRNQKAKRGVPGFPGHLTENDLDDLIGCPCARGRQTSMHMWLECEKTRAARAECLALADASVARHGDQHERTLWAEKSPDEQFQHVISSRTQMRHETEQKLREETIPQLTKAFVLVCIECSRENNSLSTDVTERMKQRRQEAEGRAQRASHRPF